MSKVGSTASKMTQLTQLQDDLDKEKKERQKLEDEITQLRKMNEEIVKKLGIKI